jgi:hypothetical protein
VKIIRIISKLNLPQKITIMAFIKARLHFHDHRNEKGLSLSYSFTMFHCTYCSAKAKEQVKRVAKALKELLQSPLYFYINSHELPPKINP